MHPQTQQENAQMPKKLVCCANLEFQHDCGEAIYNGCVHIEHDGILYECEVELTGLYNTNSANYLSPSETTYSNWDVIINDAVELRPSGEYGREVFDTEFLLQTILNELS